MDHKKVVDELTKSYSIQVKCYRELKILVQKILGKITLSRGDFSGVVDLLEKKTIIMENIIKEREKSKIYVDFWQKNKNNYGVDEYSNKLDVILEETENEIKEFLKIEEQLKKCIEYNMRKEG
ncbi:MAG: hypothetical protein PVI26_14065 [Chitinispirillia bacterium]|jgi:hypothetical protein